MQNDKGKSETAPGQCWNYQGRGCPPGAACHYPLQCQLAADYPTMTDVAAKFAITVVPTERTRSLLVRCRSTLVTALNDTPSDLEKPERASVIARLISEITETIGAPNG